MCSTSLGSRPKSCKNIINSIFWLWMHCWRTSHRHRNKLNSKSCRTGAWSTSICCARPSTRSTRTTMRRMVSSSKCSKSPSRTKTRRSKPRRRTRSILRRWLPIWCIICKSTSRLRSVGIPSRIIFWSGCWIWSMNCCHFCRSWERLLVALRRIRSMISWWWRLARVFFIWIKRICSSGRILRIYRFRIFLILTMSRPSRKNRETRRSDSCWPYARIPRRMSNISSKMECKNYSPRCPRSPNSIIIQKSLSDPILVTRVSKISAVSATWMPCCNNFSSGDSI